MRVKQQLRTKAIRLWLAKVLEGRKLNNPVYKLPKETIARNN